MKTVCSNLQSVQLYIDKWYVTSLTVQLIVFSLQRPVPPDPWNGVLDTLDIPPACPQPGEGVAYIEFHVPGFNYTSEDCLYLNIYTPKVSILYQTIFSIQCDVIRCNFRIIFFILLDINPYNKKYADVDVHLISSFKVNFLIMRKISNSEGSSYICCKTSKYVTVSKMRVSSFIKPKLKV